MKEKKIIIISYFFPPISAVGGGVIRTLKYVKYLSSFGYKPYVIAAKDNNLDMDYSLLDDIPKGISVTRVPYCGLGHISHFFPRHKKIKYKNNNSSPGFSFKKLFIDLLFPDSALLWIFPAFYRARQIMEKEKIDIIYATTPPFSALVVGYLLKKISAKPLVVDYRDLFALGKSYPRVGNPVMKLRRRLEKKVIGNSDAVIASSEVYGQELLKESRLAKDDLYLITNGFDKEDFSFKDNDSMPDCFTIYYAGSLYKERMPFLFFDAIKKLIIDRKFSGGVEIKILGRIDNELLNYGSVDYLLKGKHLFLERNISYRDSLRALNKADLLILSSDKGILGMLPGKTFEYMALGKPILALAQKDSAIVDFINDHSLGVGVDISDVSAIENAICVLYEDIKIRKRNFVSDNVFFEQFERRNLTRQLAMVLDSVLEKERID